MKLLEIENKEHNLIDMFEVILPFIVKKLDLNSLPKIKLVKEIQDAEQPTFGSYNTENKKNHISSFVLCIFANGMHFSGAL